MSERTERQAPARRIHEQAAALRDAAVALAAVSAAVLQGLAANWAALAAAILAGGLWIGVRRGLARTVRARRFVPQMLQAAFLLLGLLLVWRLSFNWLALAVLGMCALVAGADLDRFTERFPWGSSPRRQRQGLRRRIGVLGALTIASGVTVLAARLFSLQLRIVAVMLLAGFVTIVALRIAAETAEVKSEEESEPE